MARRSPRSRRKPDDAPRVPGKERPRATPGRRVRAPKRRAAPAAGLDGHAPKGARPLRPARAGVAKPVRARPKTTRRPRRPLPVRAPRAFRPPDPRRIAAILAELERLYPDAHTELRHDNPLQLLVATILSAQCTDERVNQVTPVLFAKYPDAAALAAARRPDLEAVIRSTGFYRMKARAI